MMKIRTISPVRNRYSMDESECDEDVFGRYMSSKMQEKPIDCDELNETVERRMSLMEI